MRTRSKIENPSTSSGGESRELQLLLFNFLCNVNRAAYKWSVVRKKQKKWGPTTASGSAGLRVVLLRAHLGILSKVFSRVFVSPLFKNMVNRIYLGRMT